jgi:hypothetical protein
MTMHGNIHEMKGLKMAPDYKQYKTVVLHMKQKGQTIYATITQYYYISNV